MYVGKEKERKKRMQKMQNKEGRGGDRQAGRPVKIQNIHIYRYRNIPVSLHITIEPSLSFFYMGYAISCCSCTEYIY